MLGFEFIILISVFAFLCAYIVSGLSRVWVQVLLKKGESTFEILISTGKTLFGMMTWMEMQLNWHSVRKRLKIGRLGFVILRCE